MLTYEQASPWVHEPHAENRPAMLECTGCRKPTRHQWTHTTKAGLVVYRCNACRVPRQYGCVVVKKEVL